LKIRKQIERSLGRHDLEAGAPQRRRTVASERAQHPPALHEIVINRRVPANAVTAANWIGVLVAV
jgi:hypothetical protein